MSLDHIRRGLERAVARQKKTSLSTTSPAVKAPVVAPKEEEKSKPLTQAELDYWVNLLTQAQKPKISTTDRLIRERLEAMGITPVEQ
ncbi:hypothetical protein [Stutzerimonas stutzeri]|uniref:hypothetical protein n=1 Tax=Stutzerimonas stutzeri TaxID=316 RepID=UPI002658B5A5|nr:hypothetical protein [Stutzerimonas stutzeri]MCF6782929.1 hypothetical protein [Stutzerimonas stutzeri]MCF6804040.1 hypothetical protein [Stutzerimonas stutzeri]